MMTNDENLNAEVSFIESYQAAVYLIGFIEGYLAVCDNSPEVFVLLSVNNFLEKLRLLIEDFNDKSGIKKENLRH